MTSPDPAARPLAFADYAAASFGAVVLLSASLALAFAALHRAQLDDARAYRESPLILAELATLLCSCGNLPLVAIAFIVLLVRRRIKLAALLALAGLIGFVLSYAAVALDSSTLLYAT